MVGPLASCRRSVEGNDVSYTFDIDSRHSNRALRFACAERERDRGTRKEANPRSGRTKHGCKRLKSPML